MRTISFRTILTGVALLASAGGAVAQDRATLTNIEVKRPVTAAAQNQAVRVPQSAKDHQELAALYEKVAVQGREEANRVRKSLQTELGRAASFPNKTGIEFPWVRRVKREAQSRMAAADQRANEAERAAEYHRARANEVEGLEFARLTGAPQGDR